MKLKIYCCFTLVITLFRCTNKNDSYYEVSIDVPTYLKSRDFKNHAKMNNINTKHFETNDSHLFFKNSSNTAFLHFIRFNQKHIKFRTEFKEFIEERKLIKKEEVLGEWIRTDISKKDNFDFAILEYRDTIYHVYSATSYWKLKDNLYRFSFSTFYNNRPAIDDFKMMIENMNYLSSE
jgi:hypothetical protein